MAENMNQIAGNELLRGEKVRLTMVKHDDIERYAQWFGSDIEMMRQLGFMPTFPMTLADEEQWFEHALEESDLFGFAVRTLENNQLIGNVALMRINWQSRASEVGISIADPAFRNSGYGTDTMRVILRFGFMEVNLNRIWLRVFSHNPRAIRSYEKVGFQHEGAIRASMARDHQYFDILIMSILRREWVAVNGK